MCKNLALLTRIEFYIFTNQAGFWWQEPAQGRVGDNPYSWAHSSQWCCRSQVDSKHTFVVSKVTSPPSTLQTSLNEHLLWTRVCENKLGMIHTLRSVCSIYLKISNVIISYV